MEQGCEQRAENSGEPTWPAVYEIRVKGQLEGGYWSQWFEGMTVTSDASGETVIRGPVADQAILYGLLSRLRDLALPLLSVVRSEAIHPQGRKSHGRRSSERAAIE